MSKIKEIIYNSPNPITLQQWEQKALYEMGFDLALWSHLTVPRSMVSVVQIVEEGRRLGIEEGKRLMKKEFRDLLGLKHDS